jgi:hypothetical protein
MPTEGFWLMKAEDAAGATIVGASSTSLMDPTAAAAPCDAAFGDVPVLADNSKDFTGWPPPPSGLAPVSSINPFYSDNVPYPFPGM